MDKYAIKLVLSCCNNNSNISTSNINEWFQYNIGLGFKTYYLNLNDSINDTDLHNTIQFYKSFVSIHINPTIHNDNDNLYMLELATTDFLYIPPENSLLEILNFYENTFSMMVELPDNYIIKKTDNKPLTSSWNVTLIFGTPFGAEGIPFNLKIPKLLLSLAKDLSPCNT